MKNVLNLAILGLFIFTIASCGESDELSPSKTENLTMYKMVVHGDTYDVETITGIELMEWKNTELTIRGGNNTSANGLFNTGNTMVTFSAMQNNGGVHGSTHLTGDGFFIDVKVDSDCISKLGDNTAFWGGPVTRWIVAPNPLPFGLDWNLVFAGVDNGEGNNSDPDEYGEAFIVAPPFSVPSDFDLPFDTWCEFAIADYDYDWGDHGHGFLVGEDPTNIQVQ